MPTTPLMTLVLPTPGASTDVWDDILNTAFGLIDGHDHSTGKGTPVTPAGLNINASLEMNNFALTEALGVQFQDQVADPVGAALRGRVYMKNGELFFMDLDGAAVQITLNGAIDASAVGGITGLVAPAALTYSDLTKTFAFTQDAGVPAHIDAASLRIAEDVAAGKGIIMDVDAAIAADYNFVWPAALPAAETPVVVSAAGVVAFKAIDFSHVTAGMQVGYGKSTDATQIGGIVANILADGSIPQSGEGTAIGGLDLIYTPKKTGNLLEIEVVVQVSRDNSAADCAAVVALYRDAVADAMAAVIGLNALPSTSFDEHATVVLRFHYTAPSTAAITFKVRIGRSANAGQLGYNLASASSFGAAGPNSTITVREIAV